MPSRVAVTSTSGASVSPRERRPRVVRKPAARRHRSTARGDIVSRTAPGPVELALGPADSCSPPPHPLIKATSIVVAHSRLPGIRSIQPLRPYPRNRFARKAVVPPSASRSPSAGGLRAAYADVVGWLGRIVGLVLFGAVSLGSFGSLAWGARPLVVGAAGSQAFPVALAGGSVVWPSSAGRYASGVVVRVASPGAPPRTVLRGEVTPGGAVEQLPQLAAGPRQVAVGLTDFVATDSTVKVVGGSAWAAPPGAPLQRLRAVGSSEWPAGVAVSGDEIAVLVAHRTRERGRLRLVVRDALTGKERMRRLSRFTAPFVALAGPYVATMHQRGNQDRTEVVVRNTRTWRIRTRVVVKEDSLDVSVALARDGGLAIVSGFGRYRAVRVAPGGRPRPLSPRPSSLAVALGSHGPVYLRRDQRGTRLIEVTRTGQVRALTAPIRGLVAFDAVGARLALRTRGCVYVAQAPALEAPPAC